MKFTFSLFLFAWTICSCSTQRENTYEENLAICTKKLGHYPKGIDSSSIEGAEARYQFKEQIRECMKGSMGPALTVRTYGGDSVNTLPTQGKAMILFFWLVFPDGSAEAEKADLAIFSAMNALCQKHSQSVDFIGFPFNDSSTTRRYLQAHPLIFPQVYDKKITSNKHIALTQDGTACVIFINTQGRVVKIRSGSPTSEKQIIESYSPIIQACIDNKLYSD
ncbi:TlpA family protein disulfide reductase [Hymenobacter wooponensis]|uniref:Redoxin domain-containing protein n=1 Tax=Hymenobacter wooponensis TaxID=1525360 RepID=A0A4Z0MQF4_9BACT|nr:hypothetical protein [Hymenobacter wooponensis]TGD81649.1 hypothetical protein EU557_08895 [Hymenobacter wooponensis]